SRRYDPVLCAAYARARHDQARPETHPRRGHRFPRLQSVEAGAEGVSVNSNSSCPHLIRASTQHLRRPQRRLDCRVKPGNDEFNVHPSWRAALLLTLAMLACPAGLSAHEAGGDKRLPVIGPAPNFTLTSQEGKPVSLTDLRGKVVAVTFI